jgi:hypothetical protein
MDPRPGAARFTFLTTGRIVLIRAVGYHSIFHIVTYKGDFRLILYNLGFWILEFGFKVHLFLSYRLYPPAWKPANQVYKNLNWDLTDIQALAGGDKPRDYNRNFIEPLGVGFISTRELAGTDDD